MEILGWMMKTRPILFSVMAVLFIAFCGIDAVFASSTASIQLSVASPTVPANGVSSVAITAILLDNTGMPSTGSAKFSTDTGKFPNGLQTSDVYTIPSNGIIVVSLTAGMSLGLATITCTSDNGITSTPVTVTFTATGSITLIASPEWIPSDGASSSTITAVIHDTDSNPVADGTDVTFSTTSGSFSNGLKTITVQVSGGAGFVSVSLIASNTPGIAQITCISNYISQNVVVSMGVGSIELTASPTSIPADGSSSTIKAVVMNSQNLPVPNGTAVTFTILNGSPSDVTFSNGEITITLGTTTVDGTLSGVVITSLISGTTSGTARVQALSNGVTQTVSISIGLLPIAAINLKADPTSIPADDSSSSTITATCVDVTGNLFNQNGTVLKFTTSIGKFSNGQKQVEVISKVQDPVTGQVVVSLIAGTESGIALVVCESGGVKQSTNVRIGTTIAAISLAANPTSIQADGISSSTITALLKDISGDPVSQSGIKVKFTTTMGTFSNGDDEITMTTSNTGTVVVSLIAGTTSGIALIVCESGGVTQSTNVTIGSSASVASITLTANPTSLPADGTSSSTITALLKDVSGNPVSQSGIPVVFKTTFGHFSNGTKSITVTTSSTGGGSVVVSLISDTTSGTAMITCESGGVIQSTNITIGSSASVSSITLTANPTSLPADGTSSSTITALLKDVSGNPVSQSGIPVVFKTTLGRFSNGTKSITVTTSGTGGSVVVSLISDTTSGTAVVTCESGGVIQATTVNIGSSNTQVGSITLSASPSSFSASDATLSSKITATIYTANGDPVSSGVTVTFATNLGFFSNNQQSVIGYTNASGVAEAQLYSGGSVGTAQVSASAGGINRYVYVSFTGSGLTADIVMTASSVEIPADSTSSSIITAILYDINGKTVLSGTAVKLTTTLGYFSNKLKEITIYTNSSGVATVAIFSEQAGTAQINASANGVTRYINIRFTGSGPVVDIVLSVWPPSIPSDMLSSSMITASLYDNNENRVASGVAVEFSTTLGCFSNSLKKITAYTSTDGTTSAYLYSCSFAGIAQITVSSNNVTRYIYVELTGPGPTASITMGSSSSWVPADGYSKVTIAAKITDSAGNAVAAGTSMIFMTTLGTFSNGKTSLITATPDATGTVSISLTAERNIGIAVVTCSSGSITGSVSVTMTKLEFETEPNNDMEHADAICFGNVYMSQLFSPYEEDWYNFTIKEPQRISINFLTTAIPEIAGDCKDSTTVGTYRVDIRDRDNNILMSYQNIDCSLDNGIWETGVVPAGTYYIVVYCPRLPDNGHYLSTRYYMAVFNELYRPCDGSDRLVNSASLSQDASAFNLHIPIIGSTSYFWVDLEYDPVPEIGLVFRLKNYGDIEDLDSYRSCNMATLFKGENNYILHIPNVMYNGVSYQTDLAYVPTTDGKIWFSISGIWLN